MVPQIVPTELSSRRTPRSSDAHDRLSPRRPALGGSDRGGRHGHGVPARRRVLRDLRRRDHAPRLPAGRAPAREGSGARCSRTSGRVRLRPLAHVALGDDPLVVDRLSARRPRTSCCCLPREERARRRLGDLGLVFAAGEPEAWRWSAAARADHDPAAPRDVHVLAVRVRRHRPLLLRADERTVAGDGDRDRRGGADSAGVLVWSTLLQRAVPNELLGRVRSIESLAAFALTPVAMAVVGPTADLVGVRTAWLRAGSSARC